VSGSWRSRVACLVVLLGIAGCAHVEPPPGGPDDRIPPEVVGTRPAEDAIVPGYAGPVVFQFSERISEQRVAESVIVSPRTSPVEVRHGREEIRVALRRGWQPGMIYHVTLLPAISDLFGNALGEPVSLVFSTGPPIPETQVSGRVVDRLTGAPDAEARVEAIRTTDSLVYAVPTDTAGRFRADRIPEGEYLIRAYRDLNNNRALDLFEPRDSTFATVGSVTPVEVELRLLMPDTTPPVITRVTPRADRLEIEFDDHLDPDQSLGPPQLSVTGPDGAAVPIAGVRFAESAFAPGPAPPVGPGAPPAAVALPTRILEAELEPDAELPAGEYRVAASGIRNVHGLVGDSEATFTVEPAAPPPQPVPPGPDVAP
jgi:hypothetical protein